MVEASTDLVNPTWSPVATNNLTDGWSYFSTRNGQIYSRFTSVRLEGGNRIIMEASTSFLRTNRQDLANGCLSTACASIFLLLLLLPTVTQAQDFTYTTNNGTITITGYIGPGGVVTIPETINDLPVTSIGVLRSIPRAS